MKLIMVEVKETSKHRFLFQETVPNHIRVFCL